VQRMRQGGFNLGGEQSGHIVMTDYATTGDGLMAGMQFLAEMIRAGRPASELMHQFEPVPQVLENVRFSAGQTPLDDAHVKAAIAQAEADLASGGRLLIRKSGTERPARHSLCSTCRHRCAQEVVISGERGVAGRHIG